MSELAQALIEISEYKRLLFERILHKLASYVNKTDNTFVGPIIDLNNDMLSSLFIESSETLELYLSFDCNIDEKMKLKWLGLYTTALAKETYARLIWFTDLSNGHIDNEISYLNYTNLLKESKEEKENLLKLINKK